MVKGVCPFPGAGQNYPVPLLPPCPTWISCKIYSCGETFNQNLLVSVDAVVGLELLAKTLADKHMNTVLPNCVLVRDWQRLESLVTDITWMNPFSHMLCPTTLIPTSNNMNSLRNLPLTSSGPANLFMCFLELILVLKAM